MLDAPPSHLIPHPLSIFKYQFKLWACFLVFVFLPFDLVYRLDSFLLSMTWWDVVVNSAGMILLLLIIAALVALVATLCSLLLALVERSINKFLNNSKFKIQNSKFLLTTFMLLFLSCYSFAKLFKFWVTKFHYEITIKAVLIALLLTVVIYWRNRQGFQQKAETLIVKIWRVVPVLVVCCIVLVGWRVTIAGIKNHREALEIERICKQNAASAKGKPNVILITFDALSAEDMSLYGYHLKTTPNIDEFAKQCYVFENCIAASNWTRPSVASILTGKYPDRHRLINSALFSNYNDRPDNSLPALLKARDFKTEALVANWGYSHPYANGTAPFFDYKPLRYIIYKYLPLDQILSDIVWSSGMPNAFNYGFLGNVTWISEIFRDINNVVPTGKYFTSYKCAYPPKLIFSDAENRLITLDKEDNLPKFIWAHVIPPHEPYLPPKPFKGHFLSTDDFIDSHSQYDYIEPHSYIPSDQPIINRLRLRYDENILYADDAFGTFIRHLQKSGCLKNSIVIISADHGESFSHGHTSHGGAYLYSPVVHIPLLIHIPGQATEVRLSNTASHTDVAPTILGLLGYPIPNWMDGISLKAAMEGKPLPSRPVFSMNLDGTPLRGKITKGSVAVAYDGYKYIRYLNSGNAELYGEINDPEESKNLVNRLPKEAKQLNEYIQNRIK